ncbi:hypothetical protein [Cryobacterium sp. Hz9]
MSPSTLVKVVSNSSRSSYSASYMAYHRSRLAFLF